MQTEANVVHLKRVVAEQTNSLLKFGVMIASTALQRHCSQLFNPYQGVLNG